MITVSTNKYVGVGVHRYVSEHRCLGVVCGLQHVAKNVHLLFFE